jgi:phenylacetate-CoA ligase
MNLTNSKYINLIRLLRNEHRSLDELIHIQTLGLRKLVKHSYNTVKFYRKLFDDCGLQPGDIRSIEDITKIPVIDKQLLKQNPYDDLISEEYKKRKLIPITTSGSSGLMLKFFIDNSFDQFRKAQFLRPYITNGRRPWDRCVWFSRVDPPAKRWFQYFGLMVDNKIFSGEEINNLVEAIRKIKPAIIQGYGSVLNLIATKIIEENLSIPIPRLIFTDSELLTPTIRKNIEDAFGTKVFDIYGTFETDNIAYECHHQNGYHIAMDCVIMEFIPEHRDDHKRQTIEGEIVVTVLNNFAMPFIRYNLHDIGIYRDRSCPCGRTFPLLTKIQGRSEDYMITLDGRKIPFVNIVAYWNSLTEFVHEYQVIQEDVNTFIVFVVPKNSFGNEANKTIIYGINKFFPDAYIDIKPVSAIEREKSGKFCAFKSNVKSSNRLYPY